ncbi:recombinase family protein [Clostridium beijerinckii]|uniref:recombinase family protein n=1 Tax=Clostridium beijerinckii TaxID=1520 RepID=UPI0009CD1875|nr:recombinase family protein [Clostridium beijerinckii]NRT76360.1 site-specific DNA recombinase [Clostridium beijerinckii]OOM48604.1 DNA-invertase hin [Clostridium beijerinckii]
MKVAIYSRKSKFTEEGESIENQINMCIKYAENMLNLTDYEIYEDEGFSGGNTNRPHFQKLMKDIKNKKFTHLICYRLDRISRNVADFTSTLEILNKHGVSFVSIKEQFDTSTAMGRAMMNVSATFAQLERETIAERIKDNLRELSKTGRWLGGPAPLGYKSVQVENNDLKGKSRKKHVLQIEDNDINIVKLVFELFKKYKSFQKVSLALENQGVYSRKGRVFSRELVKQMINNPVYVIADKVILDFFRNYDCEIYRKDSVNGSNAIMPYNRRKENGSFAKIEAWLISVGEHPGIISSRDWIDCQNICKEIKLKASNRQCTSQEALLSGLVICAHCGSSMAPRKQLNKCVNSNINIYRYYTCNLKNKAGNRCKNTSLNAYEAEEYVVNTIKNMTKDDILDMYLDSKHKAAIKVNNNNLIKNLAKQIETNKQMISNLSKRVGSSNDEDLISSYEDEIKQLKQENRKLDEQMIKLEYENDNIQDIKNDISQVIELYNNFKRFYDVTEKFEDKKRLIASVVKFIVWDSSTNSIKVVPIGSSLTRRDFGNVAFKSTDQKKWPM